MYNSALFLAGQAPLTLGITPATASHDDSTVLISVTGRTTIWLLNAFLSDELIPQRIMPGLVVVGLGSHVAAGAKVVILRRIRSCT